MSAEASSSRAAMFAHTDAGLEARGVEPRFRVHVPGRIEVFGKHTDYAGGRSLLVATERGFCVSAAPRADPVVRIFDAGRNDEASLSVDPTAEAAPSLPHWSIYPAAVTRRLARDFGAPLRGADIALRSDLPASSGLSSSSALLVAVFEALRLVNQLDARPDFSSALPGVLDVAAYLGSVESGRPFRGFSGEAGVGTSGGSQDHTAILASEAARVSRFGFSPVRSEGSVNLPEGATFVVAVSGVVAQKTAGAREAFNRAAFLSAAILKRWNAFTRRADATLFDALASDGQAHSRLRTELRSGESGFSGTDLQARLDQFATESFHLVPEAFEALGTGDLKAFGRAAECSQLFAEQGLGNQVEETRELPRLARALGAHAASAFGAGFGGSVWALVSASDASRFRGEWESAYRRRFSGRASVFFKTAAGPPLLRLDCA
jgi:galactokinase